jgi:hypothetical protein
MPRFANLTADASQGSPKHGASSKAAQSQQLGGLLAGGLDGAAAAQALGLTGELDPRLVEQVLQVRGLHL